MAWGFESLHPYHSILLGLEKTLSTKGHSRLSLYDCGYKRILKIAADQLAIAHIMRRLAS